MGGGSKARRRSRVDAVDEWSIATYGDPCRECGYPWSMTVVDIADLVDCLPDRYRTTTEHARGRERHHDLAWSLTAYVCHVADNLRIWAERLQGAIRGSTVDLRPYDENRLAEVRGYEAIDLQAALWSLTRAAGDWSATVLEARWREEAGQPIRLVHPERGPLVLVEVARSNCHDAVHHHRDIMRILQNGPTAST